MGDILHIGMPLAGAATIVLSRSRRTNVGVSYVLFESILPSLSILDCGRVRTRMQGKTISAAKCGPTRGRDHA